jgi:hypothetical protein
MINTDRFLFYDACNVNNDITQDSINNYQNVQNAAGINSKGDIIEQTKENKYKVVVIAGHACENEISTGSGMGDKYNYPYNKTKEIRLKKIDDSVTFFKKCLTKNFDRENGDPILFLAGCEIYSNIQSDFDPSLLQVISKLLKNVIVIGPCTLVKSELKSDHLEIKFEAKVNQEADFDFSLTLAAFKNGKRITEMHTILDLTHYQNAEELHDKLCNWELNNRKKS